MARERDIVNAVAAALDDTGLFDGIFPWALKDASDESADATRAVVISPIGGHVEDRHDSVVGDGANDGEMIQRGRIRLVFLSRDADKQVRDESAGRLLEAAKDAINGRGLVRYLGEGVIYPQWTRVLSWKWDEPQPPQRGIEAVFEYAIDAPGWNLFDTSE